MRYPEHYCKRAPIPRRGYMSVALPAPSGQGIVIIVDPWLATFLLMVFAKMMTTIIAGRENHPSIFRKEHQLHRAVVLVEGMGPLEIGGD